MIFTYEFDLHIPPFAFMPIFRSVCMFVRSASRVVTHTHTHNIKTITPTAGVINESYEHIVKKKSITNTDTISYIPCLRVALAEVA